MRSKKQQPKIPVLESAENPASSPAMKQTPAQPKYAFEQRWAPELKSNGVTQISNFFLENYHRLPPYGLTHGEAMFVVHLMQHKWGVAAPFPAYKTLAQRMRTSKKTAQRFAKSLQEKGYLYREMRTGESNRFHLNKLIAALVALKTAPTPQRRRPRGSD
jgi:hypothetical protein